MVGDRVVRETGQTLGQCLAQVGVGDERELDLARRGAMQRQRLAHPRRHAHRPLRLHRVERHHRRLAENRDERRLSGSLGERLDDRMCLTEQPHLRDVRLPKLQATNSQTVVLGGLVLLDVPPRLQRGEQPEDVILVQFQPLAQLGDTELIVFAGELLEHVERVGDRLDDVVGFLATHATLHGLRRRRFT